jgi:eukaryotic-like serine/threonine-protein kinase
MNFLNFLTTKIFFKNLAIAIIIGVFIILGAFIWLRVFTHHNQTITVPDLTGLSIEDVKIITESKKLRYEIIDSIFYKELPRGSVAKQNPRAGSNVKNNRRIYLTMNAINPEKVGMPAVTGVSLRQARAIIETYGLVLGKISYKPNIAVNVVLEQHFNDSIIESGAMINKGSKINLVLGNGLSAKSTVTPNLIGFSLFMAREFLADRYLNIGAVIYDNSMKNEEDSTRAFIWRQRPIFQEGNKLQLGANVDVWLTVDSTKLPQQDPLEFSKKEDLINEFID